MKTPEYCLKQPVFVVEANSFEKSTLWSNFSKESSDSKYSNPLKWVDVAMGQAVQVGSIGDKPVWISLNWAYIEDVLVLFWHPTSKVVDYGICENWLRTNIHIIPSGDRRKIMHDANNFGCCINDIKDYIERSKVNFPFINYCDEHAIKALRYLAAGSRPSYGNQEFNSEGLYMIADELERSVKKIKNEYNSSAHKG